MECTSKAFQRKRVNTRKRIIKSIFDRRAVFLIRISRITPFNKRIKQAKAVGILSRALLTLRRRKVNLEVSKSQE